MTTATRSPTTTGSAYQQLLRRSRDAHLLGSTGSVLHWDQEVLMPPRGVEHRSRQLALLARLHHEMLTDPRMGDLLEACEGDRDLVADPLSASAANIRELRRVYDRCTKLPGDLVQEEAELSSLGQHHWAEARRESDFARFLPHLKRNVDLMRRKAECYGWPEDGEPWDALAEDYEPGCTAADVTQVFTPLRKRLQKLLDDIAGSSTGPDEAFDRVELPVEAQKSFCRAVAERIGFDFQAGRIDTSTHPFCSGFHPRDVRITTRYRRDNLIDALSSTMHEAGHGMYEQGLPAEHAGTPMGDAISLGIHESQSRLWENQVGRCRAFWTWAHPQLREHFGNAVEGYDLDAVHAAANVVRPDFIRVEADEATYNMHIMIRFELERALLKGDLAPEDIPGVWNERYREYLGIEVPDDARGCLQDIHWSMCSMGYFPTYTLGNLYAAQFYESARGDLPELDRNFQRGRFDELLHWLNEKIHAHGQRYRAADLCEHVTGRPLSADPLMDYLEGKFRPLYGI